jgi:Predicted membrane protein
MHPVHAICLAGTFPLFLGALLSDWTYAASYEIQWTNFASWLIAGALVFCGISLLFAVIDVVRTRGRGLFYALILFAVFLLGLINALEHAKDGWAAMPAALILSVIVTALCLLAVWAGFSTLRRGEAK